MGRWAKAIGQILFPVGEWTRRDLVTGTRQDMDSGKDVQKEGQDSSSGLENGGGSGEDLGTEKVRRQYKYRTA